MRIDLSDLLGKLNLEAEITDELIDEVAKKTGLDLFTELVLTTPVDTGRARNGWTLDDTGSEIVVENQTPYIGVLNDGHSKQAPAGFVENAIDKVTRSK